MHRFFSQRGFRALLLAATVLSTALTREAVVQAQTTEFRAGAATTNISPWHGLSINGNMSDGKVAYVHDELHARALLLDDGKKRLAFVVVDSCMVPRDVVTEAKARIKSQTGIPAENVLISATHAHSCPTAGAVFQSEPDADYHRFLVARIADAVSAANTNRAPARIGWGVGSNANQVFNRRWHVKPGTIPADPFGRKDDQVRMNPPPGSPDLIEPAGPIDPQVSVISVRDLGGKPIGLLANYSLHYVGGVGSGHASADYFGAFAAEVKKRLRPEGGSPPFVAMMTNGTSGDINNINFRTPRSASPPYAQIQRVATELAAEAVRVATSIPYRDHAMLDSVSAELQLGVRKPTAEEITRAESVVKRASGRALSGLEEIYARETLLLQKYPDTVPVTIQALRVGEVGIVAIPCEVFVEIGLAIKQKSPLQPSFTIELANGYNGYLPTRAQHALGGYETWRARSSYLAVDAAEAIQTTAISLLEQLHARKPK
ncbi:MAG: neutral/alkaline non-lysosomal ceramidase N-terminal domain-containing protein [Isosphaeraceae bacterium]